MSAVFIPVSLSGPVGLYQQFAVTLAIAILISAVNALTLSPDVLLLKPHTDSKHRNANLRTFFIAFNTNFDRMNKKYVKSLGFLTRKMDRCCFLCFRITVFLFQITPSGFIPNEDRGIIFADVTLPPGST
jgi:HAE1 family hydrophobic/amphiphilic exporter-1